MTQSQQNSRQVLFDAIARKDFSKVQELITAKTELLKKVNGDGDTALIFAAGDGNFEMVTLLIEAGADLKAKNKVGETALTMSVFSNCPAVVRKLIQKQADIDHQTKAGRTALMHAAEFNQIEIIPLLIDNKADLDMEDYDGQTALMIAAKKGSLDAVRMLIKAGAKTDKQDYRKQTALMLAKQFLGTPDKHAKHAAVILALTQAEQLNLLLKRKAIPKVSEFSAVGKKEQGVTQGSIATKDNLKYLIKRGNGPQDIYILNEIIAAFLYKRFMYSRVPHIMSVENIGSQEVILASEFLPVDFQTVAQYTSSPQQSNCIGCDHYIELESEIQGVEKLFATMLLLGEYDIHANNVGVMSEVQDGKKVLVFAKIDHGQSLIKFFNSAEMALLSFRHIAESFCKTCIDINYKPYDSIQGYFIKINICKFKEQIKQICLISKTEIDSLLEASWCALRKNFHTELRTISIQNEPRYRLDSETFRSIIQERGFDNFGGCPYYLEPVPLEHDSIKIGFSCKI